MAFIFDRNEGFNPGSKKKIIKEKNINYLKFFKRLFQSNNNYSYGYSNDFRQACTLKISYTRLNNKYNIGAAKAHIEYMQKDGKGENKLKPNLLGNISEKEFLNFNLPNEKRFFKFMISPDNSKNLDFQKFIKSVIDKISLETGYQLQWAAAVHYDRPKTHAHVIIKGIDKRGKEVVFTRDQIKFRFRNILRDYLTYIYGYRKDKNKIVDLQSTRITNIDKKIKQIGQLFEKNDYWNISKRKLSKALNSQLDEQIEKRIQFLCRIGFAQNLKDEYIVSKNYFDFLSNCGQIDNFLESLKSLQINHPSNAVKFFKNKHGSKKIFGRVSFVGMKDEISDTKYFVLECVDGRSFYCNTHVFHNVKTGDFLKFNEEKYRFVKVQHAELLRLKMKYPNNKILGLFKDGYSYETNR